MEENKVLLNEIEAEETAAQQGISLRYQVKSQEVFDALMDMDRIQGSNKKQRFMVAFILAMALIDVFYFVSTKNGFALILGVLFLLLAFFVNRKTLVGNRKLADAFEKDPQQIVDVLENGLQLTDRATAYSDIKVLYEFKKSFALRYMENYYFVIPKRVFDSEEQMGEFRQQMQEQLGQRYSDRSGKM